MKPRGGKNFADSGDSGEISSLKDEMILIYQEIRPFIFLKFFKNINTILLENPVQSVILDAGEEKETVEYGLLLSGFFLCRKSPLFFDNVQNFVKKQNMFFQVQKTALSAIGGCSVKQGRVLRQVRRGITCDAPPQFEQQKRGQ